MGKKELTITIGKKGDNYTLDTNLEKGDIVNILELIGILEILKQKYLGEYNNFIREKRKKEYEIK